MLLEIIQLFVYVVYSVYSGSLVYFIAYSYSRVYEFFTAYHPSVDKIVSFRGARRRLTLIAAAIILFIDSGAWYFKISGSSSDAARLRFDSLCVFLGVKHSTLLTLSTVCLLLLYRPPPLAIEIHL